jgi:arsenite methyltransferase
LSDYLDFQIDLAKPEIVSAYDELPLWSALSGRLLLEHVPLGRNLQVLDIGCGTGFPLIELAGRLGDTCRIAGVDPWRTALHRARRKAAERELSNAWFVEGDAASLPFADGRFDLIVSNLGVNNFEKPEQVVGECRRVCRPSGKLALTSNLQGHMRELYEIFAATLEELGDAEALEGLPRHIAHRATVERLRALLEGSGFRVTRVETIQESMRFTDGSALLNHWFVKLGFRDGWKGVIRPERRREVFSRLEENLNRAAEARGSLDLTIPLAYVEASRIEGASFLNA